MVIGKYYEASVSLREQNLPLCVERTNTDDSFNVSANRKGSVCTVSSSSSSSLLIHSSPLDLSCSKSPIRVIVSTRFYYLLLFLELPLCFLTCSRDNPQAFSLQFSFE